MRSAFALLLLAGCSSGPIVTETSDTLAAAHQQILADAIPTYHNRPHSNIEELRLQHTTRGWLLTLQCQQSSLHELLRRILTSAEQQWSFEGLEPVGTITAHLENCPLEEALETLLLESPFYAMKAGDDPSDVLWIIRDRPPISIPTSTERAVALIPIHHMESTNLQTNLLRGQSSGLILNSQTVQSTSGQANDIFLVGLQPDVQALSRILRQNDQPPRHLFVEAWLVQKLEEIVEELSAQLPNAATASAASDVDNQTIASGIPSRAGHWSQITAPNSLDVSSGQIASTGGIAQGVFSSVTNNPALWNVLMQMLVTRLRTENNLHLHTVALSGQQSQLLAGRNGYLIYNIFANGVATGQTVQVSASSQVTVTPTLLPSGEIRLQLDIRGAAFVPGQFGLVAEVRSTEYTSVVQMPPGVAVCIGGVSQIDQVFQYTGWSGPEQVPFLSPFSGAQELQARESGGHLIMVAYAQKPPHWEHPPMDILPGVRLMDGGVTSNLQDEGLRPQ
ncbi:MAG: hypothetical protein ACOYKZ_03140 [Chlamydiia bacterium]